jgi:hypothetical protein
MKKRITDSFKSPWYPFSIAVYPILALLAYNISEVDYNAASRAVMLALLAVTILFLLLRWIYHDWHTAALGSAVLTALFFSYGHVYDKVAETWDILYLTTLLLIFWSLLAGLALFSIGRGRAWVRSAALPLNLVSLGLVLYTLGSIVFSSAPVSVSGAVDDHAPLQELVVPEGETPPDIYYIIIDSYGRSDLLQRAFDYDNSEQL